MSSQDELRQVGSSSVVIDEPMVQDTTIQGDLSQQLTAQQFMGIMDMLTQINESMKNIGNSMDAMNNKMDADMQAWREDRQAMDWQMAPPRDGATEPTRGSVECVRPAMETGEVGMTSDATTIMGETNKLGHEGTTKKLKEVTETQEIKETKSQELTEIINEVTETQKSRGGRIA